MPPQAGCVTHNWVCVIHPPLFLRSASFPFLRASTTEHETLLWISLHSFNMLRIIVESANGIPKKKLGNPDPIAAVIFRGERSLFITITLFFFSLPLPLAVYLCLINHAQSFQISSSLLCFYFENHGSYLRELFWQWFIYQRVHPYMVKITAYHHHKAWVVFIIRCFTVFFRFNYLVFVWDCFLKKIFIVLTGEKQKTKAIDNELNPVWNEVSEWLKVSVHFYFSHYLVTWDVYMCPFLWSQVLEFDLKGSALEESSFIDVIVKDYETIGKDKYV